jgi:hypothetical protein
MPIVGAPVEAVIIVLSVHIIKDKKVKNDVKPVEVFITWAQKLPDAKIYVK